jgi:cation:H+ antiporter
MTVVILQFVFFAGVIVVAGSVLSRLADEIAEKTGLGRLLIGSVLLASATSLPELTVDIAAVQQGNPNLAMGDLLGSSLMNLLILAVLDLTRHSRGKMFSRAAAGHALGGATSVGLTAIVALALMTERHFDNHEWLGLGPGAWLILLTYIVSVRMIFLDQRIAARVVAEASHQPAKAASAGSLARPVTFFAVAALVILLAGPRLSAAAGELAERSGLAKTFVGTTLVALSTSLPELIACLAAVRLGAVDLAIGNVFGSNAFNMTIVCALDPFQAGSLLAVVSPWHGVTAIAAILATNVTIMGQLYQVESRRWLIEPDAIVVIVIVVSSLWLVYYLPA